MPLHEEISPPVHEGSLRQDLLCLGVLGAMVVAMAGSMGLNDGDRYLCDVIGQMTSYWLPPAMAFLLAIRAGMVDLSVWMSFALGSLVSAALLVAGWPAGPAVSCGVLAGAGLAR